MNKISLFWRAGWDELRTGLQSGIVIFTFLALAAYLAVSLTNAEYLQSLGATNVSRNGATVIYLMVTGFMFFLFFSWAWIFAQPVLRDQQASLHEIVFTAPIDVRTLMWGRFFGALVLATILSSSVLFGFLIAPGLELIGWLPSGSFAPTPWLPLGFSLVWILIPTAAGTGALYFITTAATRSLAGPMAAAVVVVLFWMFCIVVLGGGEVNPDLAKVLDPSLFSFSKLETDLWTPAEKERALLPLSNALLANRLIWAILPLLALFLVLRRIDREQFILGHGLGGNMAAHEKEAPAQTQTQSETSLSARLARPSERWSRVLLAECAWQLSLLVRNRALWAAAILLIVIGMTNAFVNVIWHAEGPLLPDPGRVALGLNESLYLVIVFIVAGTAGSVFRRDDVAGIDQMLDALSTPILLRVFAKAIAVLFTVMVLSIAPALSGIFTALIMEPAYTDAVFSISYQALVIAPAQIEIAMVVFFTHALVRRAGLAYAVSIFLVAVLIANHELELVDYPPFELGMPFRMAYSPLTTWAPWLEPSLVLGLFKWALAILLIALAAIVIPHGLDSRWRQLGAIFRKRILGKSGLLALASLAVLIAALQTLNSQFIDKGGHQSASGYRAEDAAWERQWTGAPGEFGFDVQGGNMKLVFDSAAGTIAGRWELEGVRVSGSALLGGAPGGTSAMRASVNGEARDVRLDDGLFQVPAGECEAQDCRVVLEWTAKAHGWPTNRQPTWASGAGIWADAADVAPHLGLDPDRVLRVEAQRSGLGLLNPYALPAWDAAVALGGVAPAGDWSWSVTHTAPGNIYELIGRTSGRTSGPLAFTLVGGRKLTVFSEEGISVAGAEHEADLARQIAVDAQEMKRCVERRLSADLELTHVVRMPSRSGPSRMAGAVLQLAESPHWQVQQGSTGALVRRATIAAGLAQREILQRFNLRNASASVWLSEGVPGAIGLLCVGDTDGIEALYRVMARYGEATTKELAASAIPVGDITDARFDGWVPPYMSLATLAWVAGRTPQQLDEALSKLPRSAPFDAELRALLGPDQARAALGSPWSSRLVAEEQGDFLKIGGSRLNWQNGGWVEATQSVSPRAFKSDANGVFLDAERVEQVPLPRADEGPVLLIDDWPSFDPAFIFVPKNQP